MQVSKFQIGLSSFFLIVTVFAIFLVPLSWSYNRTARIEKLKRSFLVLESGKDISVAPSGEINDKKLALLATFSANLISVNFSGRDLRHCSPKFIESFTSCEVLILSNCKLPKSFFGQDLARLQKLRELYIENVGLTGYDLEKLAALKSVERAHLGSNEFSGRSLLLFIKENQKLSHLEIYDTEISSSMLDEVKQSSKIRVRHSSPEQE